MAKNLIAESSIIINAPVSKVWDALINPQMIKQYLFGTEASSDWKVGSPITYKGEWHGKTYEDKGVILEMEPEKHMLSTYWSSMGGLEDVPENYKNVSYDVSPADGGTKVTITQDKNKDEKEKQGSEGNWNSVLEGLKKLLEK